MIIVASRGRVISDRADTEGRHFRVADVDRALLLTTSVCQRWLWLSEELRIQPAPAIEQTRLGTMCLEWSPCHQSPPSHCQSATRRILPKYKADHVTLLLR